MMLYCVFLLVLWASMLLGLPLVMCTEHRYLNSTSSIPPVITPAPVFCGGCQLIYEVHASVWWPTIYTYFIATEIYTVDIDSGSTIGSNIVQSPETAIEDIDYGVNFTSVYKLRDGGTVQYTFLNTVPNAPLSTVIQRNEITMNASDYRNGYIFSTLSTNSSLTGPNATQCTGTYYTINGATSDFVSGLPSSTAYLYTTVVPFIDSYNMSNVVTYGLDLFQSYVASYLNLTVSACTSRVGGGVGTLKVGVTALTAMSTIFAQSQVEPPPELATSTRAIPGPSPQSPTITPTPSGPSSIPTSSFPPPELPPSSPVPPKPAPGQPSSSASSQNPASVEPSSSSRSQIRTPDRPSSSSDLPNPAPGQPSSFVESPNPGLSQPASSPGLSNPAPGQPSLSQVSLQTSLVAETSVQEIVSASLAGPGPANVPTGTTTNEVNADAESSTTTMVATIINVSGVEKTIDTATLIIGKSSTSTVKDHVLTSAVEPPLGSPSAIAPSSAQTTVASFTGTSSKTGMGCLEWAFALNLVALLVNIWL